MISVLKPGMFTTVQDLGRTGYMKFGVPVSGVMDAPAAIAANRMLGNPDSAAVLEITMMGPELEFHAAAGVAVTGAHFDLSVNGSPVTMPTAVKPGDHLKFGRLLRGCRAYLGVSGGLDVPVVMGSRSTCVPGGFGGYQGRALKAGDTIGIGTSASLTLLNRPSPTIPDLPVALKATRGPEWHWFTDRARELVLTGTYALTPESNRMGYRLAGPQLTRATNESLITTGLMPGSVQVSGSGKAILAMVDSQTTGGYPRILVVQSTDLALAAQLKPGDNIHFSLS